MVVIIIKKRLAQNQGNIFLPFNITGRYIDSIMRIQVVIMLIKKAVDILRVIIPLRKVLEVPVPYIHLSHRQG
ncbi:hypothetical protein HMPREF0484_1023 [Klebsiella pneumoniae subsp. rhinoscleromatis ATCC 13884]|nr:hypothetical protein HMPREF0484_1023 [Klebsiella pneumoniae subsp. rhinoscleromatis ATCC 13884]